MGFAITWCAVREEHAQTVLDELGLTPTGEREEIPESLMSTAALDTGWRVIWYNEYGCPFLREGDLGRISKERDVLMCLVEEHVMASSAELWSGGRRAWWISHDGGDGPKGLETGGDLPAQFPLINAELQAAQSAEGGDAADVDHLFDIPLKVAQAIVGFKHDEACPHVTNPAFVVLTDGGRKKGLLGRLFG